MEKKKELTREEAEERIRHCEEMINMTAKLGKPENDKISSEEVVEFKPGDMRFQGRFQTLVDLMEMRYSLTDTLLKEREPVHYKLKKVVLIFSNEKGKIKRLTFKEEDAPIVNE